MTKIVITGLALLHLLASLWHGSAHRQLAIDLPPEKTLFVFLVILLGPVVLLDSYGPATPLLA